MGCSRSSVVAAAVACVLWAGGSSPALANETFVLSPPSGGPVAVEARFDLNDVNAVDDQEETFEFVGVLSLRWSDPRQAFDPEAVGVGEKVFQGGFQFDEIAPGWYPQVVLVNESGLYESNAVILRVRPDGTCTLIQTINAVAEAAFDTWKFPFDSQHLEAVFEVLGFGRDEVRFEVGADGTRVAAADANVPQWRIQYVDLLVRDRAAPYAGSSGVASSLVLSVTVERASFYVRRLITIPLVIMVLLSFCVFWMDRSSLGDRLNISFIGILTVVSYQLVTNDQMPHISTFTLMHGFLGISFLTICATAVVNVVVGQLDQRGERLRGDLIDFRCRWVFPIVYVGLNFSMLMWAYFS